MRILDLASLSWSVLLLSVSLQLSTAGAAQAPQQVHADGPLTLDQILLKMSEMDRERTSSLHDYSSTRLYKLENKRFGTRGELQVRMTFLRPGAKTFEVLSEQGSRMIRNSVLKRLIKTELEAARPEIRLTTQITPENYTFQLIGTETNEGHQYFLLQAEPRRPSKYLFRGRIWVTSDDFAIARIEGAPAQTPSFWVKSTFFVHKYQKFSRVWLPVSNWSESDARIFGQTQVTVEYKDYRLNQGDAANHSGGKAGTEIVDIDDSSKGNGAGSRDNEAHEKH